MQALLLALGTFGGNEDIADQVFKTPSAFSRNNETGTQYLRDCGATDVLILKTIFDGH